MKDYEHKYVMAKEKHTCGWR